jgi:uncharacterized membrane protein YoaK (UPF0700 family)
MPRTLAEDRRGIYGAILLNWVAGFVDLVGWVVFAGLYTANMTGNLVAIGRAAARGGTANALRSAVPVAGFFAGLLCAALWTGARRRHWQPLAAEAVLLIGVGLAPGPLPVWAAALPAFAMGLQNATLTRAGRLSVRTTHVTGTISRLAESLAQVVRTGTRKPRERVLFLSGLLLAYLCGAVCGTVALEKLTHFALLIPAAALGCWFAIALHAPRARPARASA